MAVELKRQARDEIALISEGLLMEFNVFLINELAIDLIILCFLVSEVYLEMVHCDLNRVLSKSRKTTVD